MSVTMDVEAWLAAKLESPWSSERLASTLSVAALQQIRARFGQLDTPIKLRLLFSFASLRKKLRDDLASELHDLLSLGGEDDDEWVRVIAKMLEVLLREDASAASPHSAESSSATNHLEALALALNNEHFTDVVGQVRQRRTAPPPGSD